MKSRPVVILVAFLAAGLVACGNASSGTTAASSPTPHTSPSASASVEKLSTAEKVQVQATLQANIDHYAQLLAAGKAALGSTPYADANAGLAAYNDPNSSASKFRDWRAQSKAEQDVSYLQAFKQANDIYLAVMGSSSGSITKWENDTSTALTNWQDDVGNVQGDLALWVQVAASWQISLKTDADLAAAEQKVNSDLNQTRQDLQQLLAVS
ncbi:MAG TPA: hypothetical protein VND96_06885 [Candidatus Micrarchaeaceae archaeon]|nr:hypothetical protein [Candidatus Micrarchaeaceae archaeon]